jgi:hypothetical protein
MHTVICEVCNVNAGVLSIVPPENLEISESMRVMICHNPVLEEERKLKRQALLGVTEKSLEKIGEEVKRRKKKPVGVY